MTGSGERVDWNRGKHRRRRWRRQRVYAWGWRCLWCYRWRIEAVSLRQKVLQHCLAGHGGWDDRRLWWMVLLCRIDGSLRLSQLRLHSLSSDRWGHCQLLLLRLRLLKYSIARGVTARCSLVGGLQLELRGGEGVPRAHEGVDCDSRVTTAGGAKGGRTGALAAAVAIALSAGEGRHDSDVLHA